MLALSCSSPAGLHKSLGAASYRDFVEKYYREILFKCNAVCSEKRGSDLRGKYWREIVGPEIVRMKVFPYAYLQFCIYILYHA